MRCSCGFGDSALHAGDDLLKFVDAAELEVIYKDCRRYKCSIEMLKYQLQKLVDDADMERYSRTLRRANVGELHRALNTLAVRYYAYER